MAIENIHTYLVHPNKPPAPSREVSGTCVPLSGPLFALLNDIYSRSDAECDIGITFHHADDGSQRNDCRDLALGYVQTTTLENGRKIAERLAQRTDRRSGLGLLFLIAGTEGNERKLVISRFPTDNAIYVDEDPREFTVEFLERVFMKDKASYKAAVYRDVSLLAGFWTGRATDRQLNRAVGEASKYWIMDFLASQYSVTPAAGTRRLALAMRSAAQKADLGVQQEINAAALLARGLDGESLSISDFGDRYNLTQEARDAVKAELRPPRVVQERFEFDAAEFQRIIAFKSIELSNGGVLTARTSDFDDVFRQTPIDDVDAVRFVTEGRVLNEVLRPKP